MLSLVKPSYFFYFLTIYFFPQFISYVGLAFEQVFTILLFCVCSFYVMVNGKLTKVSLGYAVAFFSMLLYALIVSVDKTSGSDLIELAKPVYFLSFFLFGYFFTYNNINNRKELSSLLISFFLATAIMNFFGILEAQLSGFNNIANSLYKDLRGGVQYKAVVSFISPYTLGSFLLLPLFVSYFLIFYSEKKISNVLLFFFYLLGVLSTQSRTSIISLILAFSLITFFSMFIPWIKGRFFSVSIIVIVVLSVLILWSVIEPILVKDYFYLYQGLKTVVDNFDMSNIDRLIYSTPSISNRYDQMIEVWNYQSQLPIFGVMVGKNVVYPESFYAMYLLRFGIVGILLHFSFLYIGFTKSLKLAKYFHFAKDYKFCGVLLGLSFYYLSLVFSYFSSAVNDQSRTGFIFYASIGLILALNKLITNKKFEGIY